MCLKKARRPNMLGSLVQTPDRCKYCGEIKHHAADHHCMNSLMNALSCSSWRSVVSPITWRYLYAGPRETGRSIQFVGSVHNTDRFLMALRRSSKSQWSAKPGITASNKPVFIEFPRAARRL